MRVCAFASLSTTQASRKVVDASGSFLGRCSAVGVWLEIYLSGLMRISETQGDPGGIGRGEESLAVPGDDGCGCTRVVHLR